MCDTAHLASDMIGFMMSIVAMKLSIKRADHDYTYGWKRAEIIGSILSMVFLITVTIWLTKEAVMRFIHPTPLEADIMLFTAAYGLVFNLIQMKILHGDHDHGDHDSHDHGHHHEGGDVDEDQALAVRAAYLHALSDMINSIGVCIAAVIIYIWPEAKVADPICAVLFAVLVVVQVWPMMANCIYILMEGSPQSFTKKRESFIQQLKDIQGVARVYDLHVWSINQKNHALTAHIKYFADCDTQQILKEATDICHNNKIMHTTIQLELAEDKHHWCHLVHRPIEEDVDEEIVEEVHTHDHNHDHGHHHHHH